KAEWFDAFVGRSTGGVRELELAHGTEVMLMFASLAMAAAGMLTGYVLYKDGPSTKLADWTKAGLGRALDTLLSNKGFVDEIYGGGIFILRMFSSILGAVVDPWIIDGAFVKGAGYAVIGSGKLLGRLQTGNVQSYAAVFVIAIAAIILWAVQ